MNHKNSNASYDTVRLYCRSSINIPVRVFLGAKPTSSRGHDVGLGGMALYIPMELGIGTSVKLSFQLPYSRMVFGVRAIVRNCSGFRYGVEFVGLSSSELDELKRVSSILELTA